MNLIISLIVATAIAYYGKNTLRKHTTLCYTGTMVVSVALIMAYIYQSNTQSVYLNQQIFYISALYTGALATAFFIIIMYIGAVPNKHWIKKNFVGIRGQLSVIATILTVVHNISMITFVHGQAYVADAPVMVYRIMAIVTVLMYLILIPLFITSFMCVRKKMKAKTWKKLQRWAYLYYALIYIHVMIGSVPFAIEGNVSKSINVIVYSVIFITYAVLKIRMNMNKKKK